jgi:hypothetical protein
MDKCKDCKSPVARSEKVCFVCGSKKIDRKKDSNIDENLREILLLRDTDKGFNINTPHVRKSSKSRRNTTK